MTQIEGSSASGEARETDNKLERRTTMSSEPILVTGARGATGGATPRQLL